MATEPTDPQEPGDNANAPTQESLDDRRARWVHLLRDHHYEPVIRDILRGELPKYTNSRIIDPTDLVGHMRECALILASAPEVFFAAVEGNLVSRMAHDADLRAEHAEMLQQSHDRPSIYVHLLADEEGNAPTPAQYLLLRDAIALYLSSPSSTSPSANADANAIDNISPPPVSFPASTRGYRKYLSSPSTPRSTSRLTALHHLLRGITNRCTLPPHLTHIPLPFPPAEVGYSAHAPRRLAQHRAHRSSNAVMNLVEDVCTFLYRTNVLDRWFRLHQYVVFLIWRRRQAAMAEVFSSAVLQSWVQMGGLNAWPAGRSVRSAEGVGDREWERLGGRAGEGALTERLGVLRERAGVWGRALVWKERDEGDEGEEGEDMDVA